MRPASAHVVDLGVVGSALAQPVGEFAVRPVREQERQVLADELLGAGTGVDQLGVRLPGDGLPAESADGVHQADVEKEQLEHLLLQARLQRKP